MDKARLVYVCEGGDCSEKGSIELHNELKARLAKRDPEGRNKLRKYPCFGSCEHGVNIALFPDRVAASCAFHPGNPGIRAGDAKPTQDACKLAQ